MMCRGTLRPCAAGKPQRPCESDVMTLLTRHYSASNGRREAPPGFPTTSPEEDPHVKLKLTAKAVAGLTLPPGKRDHITWDSELQRFGFRLRLGANGKLLRTWVVQHKRAGRTSRLQQSAEVFGAEQARAWAKKLLARIDLGEDPAADRSERRDKDRVSFKAMVAEHLLHKQAHIRPRTLVEDTRYLTGPYFKPLHNLPIDQVARKDIAARLVAIGREHSSKVAAKARARVNTFFVWAMQSGLVAENPVVGTFKGVDSTPRERVLVRS